MPGMIGSLKTVALDAPDIARLSAFYGEVAGLEVKDVDDDWITMVTPEGWRVAFQLAPDHVPPRWPDPAYPQQMHLDLLVPDLEAAAAHAEKAGATRLPGGGDTYTVLADPAGHPFCLCHREGTDGVRLADVCIDCPDGKALARFYAELLGMDVTYEGEEGAMLSADGQLSVVFQNVPTYNSPRWPDPAFPQQFHFDVNVDNIEDADKQVLAIGATRLPGGGESWRVYADPVGHPFCLIW